ncbi:MAG: polysaccharide deacetylase [Paenibacillaceae bacterium]|jgi:peptidoglycan/xylan/chitin deacetylase (PgdA/CDA1 family)|nr:polysaccharide deacetylase [Paenibacillaceae bacterium]
MSKLLLRITLLCCFGLTMAVSSLSAFNPDELYGDEVAVLMYHHISDQTQGPGTISTSLFSDQLSFLESRNYNFITLDQFTAYMEGASVPDNAVLVTFDDGYESFYKEAYPILKEHNIPAVSFVITGTLADPDNGSLPFLDKEQLSALADDEALISLGCHTDSFHEKRDGKALLTHKLTVDGKEESDEQYRSRIVNDMKACSSNLQEAGSESGDVLAYPFGIYNRQAIATLKESGVRYAFTVMPKLVTRSSDPMRLPRINAGSPYVQAEALHNMIMRRITTVDSPHDNVFLRETLEQIGGELFLDKNDKAVCILYNGEQYKIGQDKHSIVRLRDGKIFQLSEPIHIGGRRMRMSLKDLQQTLGISIVYDPHTKTYIAESPADSDSDTETAKSAP